MDPLKLLSRSTKLHKQGQAKKEASLPSGQQARPQLFAGEPEDTSANPASRKRKRGQDGKSKETDEVAGLDFFGGKASAFETTPSRPETDQSRTKHDDNDDQDVERVSEEHARHVLKQHKLKMTWLNPQVTSSKAKRKAKEEKNRLK